MGAAYPVTIKNCEALEANTVENPSWLGPTLDLDMVYRYPGMPTTGSWSGVYRDLMSFRSAADITAARSALRTRIWQSTDMIGGTYNRVATVGDHVEYEIDMPYWFTTSRCWLYHTSATATGTLLIVHGGHDNHGPLHPALLDIRTEALAAGHDVLVVSMPGQSVNAAVGPYPYSGVNGVVASHQNLPTWNRRFLNQVYVNATFGTPPESAFHVFYAPVHRMINAIGGNYDRIAMTGLSGGASTTIRCAALDERISAIYPVAGGGCVPRFAYYTNPLDFGDNEDQDRTWLELANEEETLVMIASSGRRALVFLNSDDPVYAGTVDVTKYAGAVSHEAKEIAGGVVCVHVETNSSHSWAAATRARILSDIASLGTSSPAPFSLANCDGEAVVTSPTRYPFTTSG